MYSMLKWTQIMSFSLSPVRIERKSRIRRAHLPPLSPPAASPSSGPFRHTNVLRYAPLSSSFLRGVDSLLFFSRVRFSLLARALGLERGGERNSPATSFSFHLPLSFPLSLSLSLSCSCQGESGEKGGRRGRKWETERRSLDLPLALRPFLFFCGLDILLSH